MKSKMVSIRMKNETKTQLQKEADKQGRSLTNYILFLISKGRTSAMKKGLMIFIALLISACGHQDGTSATLPAWDEADQQSTINGCISSAHATRPSASFTAVETYCQCMLTETMHRWSASDFVAQAAAYTQTLVDNGTVASCRSQAGL